METICNKRHTKHPQAKNVWENSRSILLFDSKNMSSNFINFTLEGIEKMLEAKLLKLKSSPYYYYDFQNTENAKKYFELFKEISFPVSLISKIFF